MEQISAGEMERTMKMQEVILRAIAKKITRWEADEILGISERTMRRGSAPALVNNVVFEGFIEPLRNGTGTWHSVEEARKRWSVRRFSSGHLPMRKSPSRV